MFSIFAALPRRMSSLSLVLALAAIAACLAFVTPAQADPAPIPLASNAPSPSAKPSSGAVSDDALTTVGIRPSSATQPDDRGTYDYEVAPGGYKVDYFAVTNYSTHPVDVRMLAEDATSTAEVPFDANPGTPHDLGSWITLERQALTIPARAIQIVAFQVSPPHNATPGDHAGAIVVSLLAHQADPKSGQIVVDHRVGLRMNVRIPGQMKPCLQVVKLQSKFVGDFSGFGFGRMLTDYYVVNKGNVKLSGPQAVTLTRWFLDDVKDKVSVLPDVLPGGGIHVRVTSPFMFAFGPVDTKVSGTPQNATAGVPIPKLAAQVTTWVIPWLFLLIVLLLVALWFARRYWRRRRARKREALGLLPIGRRASRSGDARRAKRGGRNDGGPAPTQSGEMDNAQSGAQS